MREGACQANGSAAGDRDVAEEHHKAYAPSPPGLLRRLLPVDEVTRDDVFVDFGCGAGRVVMEAAERYPFRRVVGVEHSPELAAQARALLDGHTARLRTGAWEIVTADVVDYEVPDDITVAYLFDPFTGPVFDAVASKLEDSVQRRPRTLRIVYLVPTELARLERHAGLRRVRSGTARRWRTGGRFDYFVGDLLPQA